MEKLFTNIGKIIMAVSKIFFVLLTIGGVITGIVFMSWGYEEAILLGIGTVIASPFVAYLSTILLYGFGKLVDSAEKIEKKMTVNGTDAAPVVDSNELPEI